MRCPMLALCLVGCAPSAAAPSVAKSTPAAQAPRASASAAASEPDPEPEWHDHPELSADDLAAAPADAPAPSECSAQKPPPLAPSRAQHVYSGPPITNRIPPELVMAPIRKRAACFRACYDAAKTSLSGRIAVRFVVDRDGWVRRAKVQDSDLSDDLLLACVARQFVGLQYPAPEGGPITVVYPLRFEPRAP